MGQLPFVHPGLATAALAAGLIPIAIHFLNRRRHRRVPWAAMSFLLAARRKSRRRIRFEQWLLMLARMAVIVLLGLSAARPYAPRSSLLPVAAARSHHVMIVDDSLSQCARESAGRTRFDFVREWMDRLMVSLPDGDAVSVITLSAPATSLIAEASFDRRFVRETLRGLGCTARVDDLSGGLAGAMKILRDSKTHPGNRFVYLISDLPRRSWTGRHPGETPAVVSAFQRLADALPDPARQLIIVRTASESAENLALTGLKAISSLVSVGVSVPIEVEVANVGSSAIRGRFLDVLRGSETIRRERLATLEAGAKVMIPFTVEFASPGAHIVEARLTPPPDALAEDDTRRLSVHVPDTLRVLLIDGEPGLTPLSGQCGFLSAALSPSGILGPAPSVSRSREERDSTPLTVRITSDAELIGEALAEIAVVALCNVQRLSEDQWRLLGSFVSRGGGLLIFAGDLLSPENYNRFGFAEGQGPLPGTFLRAAEGEVTGASADPLGFKLDAVPHSLVKEFADQPLSGLFVARVMRYLPFVPDPIRGEIILRYTNDQSAIVVGKHGSGRVVVCTTTANMSWTNLPAKGDYVSLMLTIVSHLTPDRDVARNLTVGQTLREPVTAAQASLPMQVTTSDGKTAEPSIEPQGDGLAVRFGPLQQPGVVRLAMGTEMRDFAVNTDPSESDLPSIDAAAFAAVVRRPHRFILPNEVEMAAMASPQASELARIGFFIVLGLLVVELLLAARFGRQRG